MTRDLEATFAAHVARSTPAYYIKSKREVDVAWYEEARLRILEVKWAGRLRPEELKEIRNRRTGVVAARTRPSGDIDGVRVLPATVCLLRLSTGRTFGR